MVFVWRSFYGMRIGGSIAETQLEGVGEMGTDREGVATR
jgi:hypothetical protein